MGYIGQKLIHLLAFTARPPCYLVGVMKQTISTNEAAHQLYNDENAGWSFKGATALAEYLEELEEETGGEMEFNRVDVRCEYSEYSSLEEAFRANCSEAKEILLEQCLDQWGEMDDFYIRYLGERTNIVWFEGGVIIRDY
tara:strand:- start:158 stop:577 length:420 start_codon:yes stop_codon:yes gene_type:complete